MRLQARERKRHDYASISSRSRATTYKVRLRLVVQFNHHNAGHCIKRKLLLGCLGE